MEGYNLIQYIIVATNLDITFRVVMIGVFTVANTFVSR